MDLPTDASRIGVLADPTREALYAHVVAQGEAVSRDAAAEATNTPTHTAKFHLDKLVDARLLEVEFRRLSGRSGPGAGRPSKLYRRSQETVSVSLPPRQYDLAGHLLATAIERSAQGLPLPEAIATVSSEEGRRIGANTPPNSEPELGQLGDALTAQGYEPHFNEERMLLANCPFDRLAQEHTDLICAMNHSYVSGIAEGLGCTNLHADLDPTEGRCCVVVHHKSDAQ